jgi:hypothetical protein
LTAGDWRSVVPGNTKDTPSWVNTKLLAGRLLGVVVVGSGKLLTRWARMHSATASICFSRAADGDPDPPGPAPGRRLAHVLCAAWNAGVTSWRPKPRWPPAPGSEKFDTPCERMHPAYLIPADGPLDALLPALLGLLADPQPATVSTPDATATTVSNHRRRARKLLPRFCLGKWRLRSSPVSAG